MPISGRNPDEAAANGLNVGPNVVSDGREVARFPRPAEPVRAVAFGRFVLDPARGALLHDGTEVRLRAKSLDVLGYLVRHPGRLIGKQELMDAIWPDAAVTDDSLVQCLVEIGAPSATTRRGCIPRAGAATGSMAPSGRAWGARQRRPSPWRPPQRPNRLMPSRRRAAVDHGS